MDLKAIALNNVVSWIVGFEFFDKVKELVNGLMADDGLTGSEKRTKVINELADWGHNFASFIVNAAIEVAVVLAKRELGIK